MYIHMHFVYQYSTVLFIDLTSRGFVFFLDGSRSDSRGERFGGVGGGRDKRMVKKLVSWKSTLLIAIQTPGQTRYNYTQRTEFNYQRVHVSEYFIF